jgi:tRNA(Leu) C34 or U34 (ribose-2'-O)-methylase TrmL
MITLQTRISSDTRKVVGEAPAVVLINPKYQENFSSVVRACACFDVKQLWYTGNRITFNPKRLPRELRLKDYLLTNIYQDDRFFDRFPTSIKPVAIEILPGAQNLSNFEWDFDNNILLFGPEDGSIPSNILRNCVSFVQIPTNYCINLSAACYLALYDRASKLERKTNPWN